ncbi:MAG: hypothetical protein ACYCVM_00740 [Acidiferrobacter sp.]
MMKVFMRAIATRRDHRRLDWFFGRYRGRTLIIHQGLTVDWLEELLKLGGGGRHFRFDARTPLDAKNAVSWVVHRYIVPLELPLPVLCDVGCDTITVRHLLTRGRLGHPADIAWILDDMRDKSRVHATLTREAHRLATRPGLPTADNAYEVDFGE